MPVICDPDAATARRLSAAFRGHGRAFAELDAVEQALASDPGEFVVVLGPHVDLPGALAFAGARRMDRPALAVILVRERLEVDVLAESMRAGVREVVPDRDFPALMEACRRGWEVAGRLWAAERERDRAAAPAEKGRVVVVFAGKGGCGKSMVSTNLAVSLAARGGSACLVDLDLAFGDVGIMLRADPHRTIVDAVPMAGHMDETGVESMLVRHPSGVRAVLAPVTPGEAEKISGKLVTELLSVLSRMFDTVVVDTSPQFSEQVLAALDAADRQLLIATPEVTALKGLRVTLGMLELLGYPADAHAVVLNRADAKAGLSQADIDRVVGRPIAAHVPTSPDVPASINRGVPLVQDDPQHPVSRAIADLAQRLTAGAEQPAIAAPGRRGLRRKARSR
ncbi:AAA family ATPase [Thermomonospora umbrina]|uniref:Pilus assembly protein CpaE n=1 Tax=Thermomonospora umbrina TaxID=111806 RepID=A0A3D9SW66_9ACTN|nr:P-loop NTPase [Thermomonospora umbrina]REE96814.1 pilus assembly protein CpaE [Thermomonospora umbrina]